MCMFLAFSPEQLCSNLSSNIKFAFIELTSFQSFDSEVPSFYFRLMPPFAHKPFLQSISKPLNAQYST